MADTNAWRWVPSELIWKQQLELPGSLVSTKLMNTCCRKPKGSLVSKGVRSRCRLPGSLHLRPDHGGLGKCIIVGIGEVDGLPIQAYSSFVDDIEWLHDE